MNRKFITKFSNFVLGNGFYIALSLCVALIVLSGYYLMSTMTATTPTAPVSGTVEMVIPEQVEAPELVLKPVELPEPEIILPVFTPEEDSSLEEELLPELGEELLPKLEEEAMEPVVIPYVMPCFGEITQNHSLDVLVFHPTMGDWRTHNGIDITAEAGTAVMAVADGEVTAVFTDDMMGTTVVIAHGEEVESTYANLGEFPTVSLGDWVTAGKIIAVVGNSALAESGNEPHLQFSMTKAGEQVDPMAYLPSE